MLSFKKLGGKGKQFYIEVGIIISVTIIVWIIASKFELLENMYEYSREHEELEIDELIPTTIISMFLLIIVLIRRSYKRKEHIQQIILQNLETLVKERTADLLKEKNLTMKIIKSIPDGIIVLEPDGSINLINNSFKTCYNNTLGEEIILPLNISTLDNSSLLCKTIKKLHAEKRDIQVTIEAKPGYWLQLSSVAISISEIQNSPISVIIVIHDISNLKEFEAFQSHVLSVVSHELRTPVTIIDLGIKNLEKYWKKLDEYKRNELIKMVSKSSTQLIRMIENVLTICGIEEGQIKLKWEKYRPSEILNEVLISHETFYLKKELTIHLNTDPNIELWGDKHYIHLILKFLIENAIEYSKHGSSITISTEGQYFGKYNSKKIDGTIFKIIDTGIGIKKEELPFIFKRFYRSNDVINIPGTGLSLVISKKLALLHHGDIYVESEFGKGSTFLLFLPRMENLP